MFSVARRILREIGDLGLHFVAVLFMGVLIEVLGWWMPKWLAVALALMSLMTFWYLLRMLRSR